VRFLPTLRERNAGANDRRFMHHDPSSPQRNPYNQFDDKNYEMGDVRSTTNLTSGLSGGGQEPMSDFYDEVIPCSFPSATSTRYHGSSTPAAPITSQPEQFAHADPRLFHTF